jgi:hypothetical protein
MSEIRQPTALDHLHAWARLTDSAQRRCYDEAEGPIMASVVAGHAEAIKAELLRLAGENDRLRHLAERQQEAINEADQKGMDHA